MRVGVGHNQLIPESLLQELLLIEWPPGESEPTKYWLSTLPADISFYRLVDLAKLRWRIERDQKPSRDVLVAEPMPQHTGNNKL
jgi:SRSO17 transposase